ncbi:hypothetical protein Ae201684P_006761 [Aphanomyces euteiches]|nr:hypothetical protein Ae201684P_006761 [Aphanomyces euteiches]
MSKKEKQHFLDEIRLDVSSFMQMMGSINSQKSKTKEPNDRKEIIKAMGGENAFRVLDRMAITTLQAWLQRTVHQNIAKWHETQGFLLLDGGSIEESFKTFNTAREMYASVAHPTLPSRNLWRVEAACGFVKMMLGDPLHAWEEKLLSRYSDQESFLGVDHFDTVLTGFYIGSMYNTVGEAKKAREWLQRCSTLAQEHPDLKNHPRRLRIMLELASATHRCGAYHDTNKLIEATTTHRRELLVEDHPSFSETCIYFATCQFDFGDYKLAESTLLPALRNLSEHFINGTHLYLMRNC